MQRIKLIRYGTLTVTPDTRDVLEALGNKATEVGWRVGFDPSPWAEDDGAPRYLSLSPAGRGFKIEALHDQITAPTACLAALWSMTVPLGLTPWNRYPVPGHKDHQFHNFGPWKPLMDRLLAEGRGHLAWPSVCCAAQVDAGIWKGDKTVERFVQAQLHRIGYNVGPVDGIIGPRTAQAIETMGLSGIPLKQIAETLVDREPPTPSKRDSSTGHIVVPGRSLSVASFGDVRTVQTNNGVSLDVRGRGRVVVDIGGSR